jgi:hypothetical protein
MRASWLSSLLSGILLGIACRLEDNAGLEGSPVELLEKDTFSYLVVFAFFALLITTVIGVDQLREFRSQRSLQGFFHCEVDGHDWEEFYLPAWGRLLVYLLGISGTAALCHAWWM